MCAALTMCWCIYIYSERKDGCAGVATYFDAVEEGTCLAYGDEQSESANLPYLLMYSDTACNPDFYSGSYTIGSSCSLLTDIDQTYQQWGLVLGNSTLLSNSTYCNVEPSAVPSLMPTQHPYSFISEVSLNSEQGTARP